MLKEIYPSSRNLLHKVVFPVPATPVIKIFIKSQFIVMFNLNKSLSKTAIEDKGVLDK